MAVREAGVLAKRWTGLSTDLKPFVGQVVFSYDVNGVQSTYTKTGVDVPGGSEFLETDTNRTFRWDGAAWREVLTPEDPQMAVLFAMLGELRELRQLVFLACHS